MTRRVKILQRETIFNRFIFQIEELELCHEKFDGSMGPPIKRLVLDRGDAAAIHCMIQTAKSCYYVSSFALQRSRMGQVG